MKCPLCKKGREAKCSINPGHFLLQEYFELHII